MTERWERVKELFHEALDRDPGERAAFLDGACGGDKELRHQVEVLLTADERAGEFLEDPVLAGSTSPGSPLQKVCPWCNARYDAREMVCPKDGRVLVEDGAKLVGTTLDAQYQSEAIVGA